MHFTLNVPRIFLRTCDTYVISSCQRTILRCLYVHSVYRERFVPPRLESHINFPTSCDVIPRQKVEESKDVDPRRSCERMETRVVRYKFQERTRAWGLGSGEEMAKDEDPRGGRMRWPGRERYSTESNVGVVSWIDTNGGALCPRLPLVIAKPRRARFSPFLSYPCPLVLFAPIRPTTPWSPSTSSRPSSPYRLPPRPFQPPLHSSRLSFLRTIGNEAILRLSH